MAYKEIEALKARIEGKERATQHWEDIKKLEQACLDKHKALTTLQSKMRIK